MNALQGYSEKGMAARYGKGYALNWLPEAMGSCVSAIRTHPPGQS